ncbi:small-conductance mechanosensitive channel [Formosa agariphila KMM 3901]|uniref:Small-conductance mechanosensitive channel n=1 Tax=Formosa agariphila (strain DSM 15362 / KCTC 12365 / LMG 23005 / KMM 3901 / M-2Alg 35-1) TaxID=1347342 RepID=T2KPW9_FORAG|nr:mechanosensitive ion channel domain-containing protein [Formosa agariphila]CDF80548.1 small-conductance mechanosensitive channel [Formosa agariphila KMM 3901]
MKKYSNLIFSVSLLIIVLCLNPIAELLTRITTLDFSFLTNQKHNFLIAVMAWISIEVLHKLKKRFLTYYDITQEDNLHSRKVYTQFNILEKVIIFIIIMIATGLILLSFENIRKVGVGLFASAGVAGIILGLSAQKVVGALLAGIQIAITQPFRIDDAVVVEGEWGWIEEINLTYVVIRIWDKRRLVLPSSYFLETPFQNWTRNNADIMGTIFLYTDYNIPFDDLRTELTRLLEGSDLWDGKVNVLQVTESKETTVESRILVSARNSPTAWDLRVYIREKMIEYIQKNYPNSLPRTRVVIEKNGLDL